VCVAVSAYSARGSNASERHRIRPHQGDKVARCLVVSHPFGWELRLMAGELVRSQVCRSSEEILTTQEAWKAAMIGKGWASPPL